MHGHSTLQRHVEEKQKADGTSQLNGKMKIYKKRRADSMDNFIRPTKKTKFKTVDGTP